MQISLNNTYKAIVSTEYPNETIAFESDQKAKLKYVDTGSGITEQDLLVHFEPIPTEYRRRGVKKVLVRQAVTMQSGWPANYLALYAIREYSVDANHNTWNKIKSWIDGSEIGTSQHFEYQSDDPVWLEYPYMYSDSDIKSLSAQCVRAIRNGICIKLTSGSSSKPGQALVGAEDGWNPLLKVELTDSDVTWTPKIKLRQNQQAYYNPRAVDTIRWALDPYTPYYPYSPFTQQHAVFHWRVKGSDEYTDISIESSVTYINIPANTFPVGEIEVYVTVVADGNDETKDSDVVVINTEDAIPSITSLSPSGTWVDRSKGNYFRCRYRNEYGNRALAIQSAYSLDGENWVNLPMKNIRSISYDSNTFDVEFIVPADTFPKADVVYWKARLKNRDNQWSDWSSNFTFKTVEPAPVRLVAELPSSTIEDSQAGIAFRWSVYTYVGQSGVDLQYSTDNSIWMDMLPPTQDGPQVVTSEHSFELPSGILPAGLIYWRLRVYNTDDVKSDWSNVLSFICRGAPVVNSIEVDRKPFATINWQVNDQLTYEVLVDGESLGSFFGGERQYQLPDYLSDGDHTVGVRVLGSFSLWSQIAETNVHIENSPALQLVLKAMTDIDTELVWTGGVGDFYIYRDGLMIGHTNEHSFTDRTAVGVHDYLVVERLASGDYNASAVLTRTPSVDCQHIAALAGGEWIAIPHTLKSQSDPAYSESQEVEYNYLAGNDLPTASIGSQRDDSASYSAVFLYTEQDEHKRFLALRGKPVIFKTADGEVMIGILHAWERKPKLSRNKQYYTAYTFSIQRVGWGDFIDDTV